VNCIDFKKKTKIIRLKNNIKMEEIITDYKDFDEKG
jgi:hypothetical protein